MLLAAIVVGVIGSIAFARRGTPPNLTIRAEVIGTPTPTSDERADSDTARVQRAFSGSGSWALSSLPSCFRERERRTGSVEQLRAMFPPASQRLGAASIIHAGDCTIVVGPDDLQIVRGADRLRVPPRASLYQSAGRLTLVYEHGKHAEIRRY